MKRNYQRTLKACYLGFITQAIAANFTQLLVDVFCARFVDKIGYRKSVVASEVVFVLGLVGLAFIPDLCANPVAGIVACVIMYAIGSGLIEVLCSPIVEACPL